MFGHVGASSHVRGGTRRRAGRGAWVVGVVVAAVVASGCADGSDEPGAASTLSPVPTAQPSEERAFLDRAVAVVCGVDVEDLRFNYGMSSTSPEIVSMAFDIGDTGSWAIASHFDKVSEAEGPHQWHVSCPGVDARFSRAEFSAILDGVATPGAAAPDEPAAAVPGESVPADEDIYEEPHPGIAAAGGDFECPAPAVGTSDEQAALCLHRAWVFYDSGLASEYASDDAVATLFAEPWDGETEWAFAGCETFASAAVCSWEVGDGTTVEMRLGSRGSGSYIESVRWGG